MKNITITILCICFTWLNVSGQISGTNYNYTVLKNDYGLNMCKGVFELNENLLLFDNNKIVIYEENSIAHTIEFTSDQTIDAISILDDLIYCALSDESGHTINIYDKSLNQIQSTKLNFLISDFEKTPNGYFFFNSKVNENNEPILFFTNNDFVRSKIFFESSSDQRDLIIGSTSKMVRKDEVSIYFNFPGTGEIYKINENETSSLVCNMGTIPSNLTGSEEMNLATIKDIARYTPILMYSINERYLVFFSQKNGNHIYYYNRNTKDLDTYPALIQYDLIDKFDFTATSPSTFLKNRNRFAAILKGRDIHMIKDIVTPASKTNHIPDCDKSDIVLMTFSVKN